jgi:hypothetical protein
MGNSSQNGPKIQKRRVFGRASQTSTKSHGPCKSPRTPKLWAIALENGHKRKKDEFLVISLKHVLRVMGLVNHPGIPKLWAIAHEKGHKRKNDDFLVMSLKHLLSVMGLVHYPRTPKLWAHENGPKTQKR